MLLSGTNLKSMKKTVQPAISNQYKSLDQAEAAATAIVQTLYESGRFPIQAGELSIVFVDDPVIADIHGRYLNDPTATDVITFPADSEMASAGEIIISVDHARTRAKELHLPVSHELSLYLAHGWLHLAGYDDRNESDREKMRAAEAAAIHVLAAEGALDGFRMRET